MTPNAATSLVELLAHDGAEHELLRQFVMPEEDRVRFTTGEPSGYRWFRSPKVVCIEKARRLREKPGTVGT
jgi:hypothetical protein